MMMSNDIGIDLGTASILVYIKGKGVVLKEPSVVALDRETNKVITFGEEARLMIGRTPGNIVAVRPLRKGVISDYTVTEKMLKYFINKAVGKRTLRKPRIAVCIPSGATEVERKAVEDATYQAGAREVCIIEEPVAAAIGAGIDISKACGNMIVDIGGGTADIAVISLGGTVVSTSIKTAGDDFDEALVRKTLSHAKMYKQNGIRLCGCQGCLAHPCVEVCPKDAVTIDRTNGRSKIDPDKCIRCGQCANVCAYHAIIIQERPCAAACGMDAIHSDMNGKADIDYNKCVSCGQCLVNCPFGAIADKSQIFQVIRAIQTGERVYAAVAPAFVGQFGPKVTPGKLRAAMKALGFADVFEVAIGADLCAVQEAEDFVKEVPEQLPFMATSCCPAWSVMAKKLFPDYSNCISMALTPMTLTARLIKKKHEKGKVVFIGPCAAKKLEAMRTSVRSDVDFVLTFEEMAGIFDARHVDIENIEEDEGGVNAASKDGRNFAVAGGVAKSVVDVIAQMYP